MELEAIESIFGGDVEDLRPVSTEVWKPLNLRIAITPLQGSFGPSEIYVRISLRVICSAKYPSKVPPKVSLELVKGLSDNLIEVNIRNISVSHPRVTVSHARHPRRTFNGN